MAFRKRQLRKPCSDLPHHPEGEHYVVIKLAVFAHLEGGERGCAWCKRGVKGARPWGSEVISSHWLAGDVQSDCSHSVAV